MSTLQTLVSRVKRRMPASEELHVRHMRAADAIRSFDMPTLRRCLFGNESEAPAVDTQTHVNCGMCTHSEAHYLASMETAFGMTLLHHAIVANNAEAFQLLTAVGSDIGSHHVWSARAAARRRRSRQTWRVPSPLHVAVYHNRVCFVERLLELGAWLDSTDCPNSFTPLHFAARWRDNTLLDMLLARGANVQKQNNIGITPLHLACKYGNIGAVTELLRQGALPNAVDDMFRTPLLFAVYGRHWMASGLNLAAGRPDMQQVMIEREVFDEVPVEDYAAIIRTLVRFGALVPCHCCSRQHHFGRLMRHRHVRSGEERSKVQVARDAMQRTLTRGSTTNRARVWYLHVEPPLLHAVRSAHAPLVRALMECSHAHQHEAVTAPATQQRRAFPAPLGIIAGDIFMHEFNASTLRLRLHDMEPMDVGSQGWMPMLVAEIKRKLPAYEEIARLLIEEGEDPWELDPTLGRSPMDHLRALAQDSDRVRHTLRRWQRSASWTRRKEAVIAFEHHWRPRS